MFKKVIATVVLSVALVLSQNDFTPRVGSAIDCNIFDDYDIEKFDQSKCSSTRITGIVVDLDGYLRFEGLSRDKTVGLYK